MTIFFITVFTLYFLFLLSVIYGWNLMLNQKQQKISQRTFSISVLVPFRNEEKRIPVLIESLKKLDYPYEKFEVIFIDDHSTDDSLKVVNKLIAGVVNFRVINSKTKGKKNAITEAINISSSEVIATSDADCQVPHIWLDAINAQFQNPSVKLVAGAVRIEQTVSFFSRLQAMEFSSLMGTAAATIALGFPSMCSGANLAYHRASFVEVGGFIGNTHIASGDDEFLMRKIERRFGARSIQFLNHSNSIIATTPLNSIKEFLTQRMRWAGKWQHNSSIVIKALALFIVVFQVSYFSLLVASILIPINYLLITGITLKILLEGFFILRISKFLQQRFSTISFCMLQLIYPVYVITIGILANLLRVSWKGRAIK
ncbi:MAG: glycosyltransferase [Bacteroidia bacterium]|nr:glycosyltransferase [Bacteroidia bacterium]